MKLVIIGRDADCPQQVYIGVSLEEAASRYSARFGYTNGRTIHPDNIRELEVGDEFTIWYSTIYKDGVDIDLWDKNHDQQAECECGHQYERHFESYDDMSPVGCKYCGCDRFVQAVK